VLRAAVLLLLAGCAASAPEEPPPEPRADEPHLDVPTQLKARTGKIVLSSHWRSAIELEAIHVERGEMEWIAKGSARLKLRGIEAEIRDELKITFLDDHEHFVLYATDVEVIARRVGWSHRHENVEAITIADDKLSLFSR
jgi:hypothetical protein